MIVMEYLDQVFWWDTHLVTAEHLEKLKKILILLRDNMLVHGDLREPNVLMKKDSKEVFVVDFGFSGPDGQKYYPGNLCGDFYNTGAEPLGKITHEIDCNVVKKLLVPYEHKETFVLDH